MFGSGIFPGLASTSRGKIILATVPGFGSSTVAKSLKTDTEKLSGTTSEPISSFFASSTAAKN